jgi:hypothetical protein
MVLKVKLNPKAPINSFRDRGVRLRKGDDWKKLPRKPGLRTKHLIRKNVIITDKEHPFGNSIKQLPIEN